jgi:hypothetical protein
MKLFNNIKQVIKKLAIISCLIVPFYLIYKFREIDPPARNETWCSSLVYFDTLKSRFDTTYTQTTLFEDSIVSFVSEKGTLLKATDFVKLETRKNDDGEEVNYITYKDGKQYEIITVDSGKCQIKSVMDSIREDNLPDDNDSAN